MKRLVFTAAGLLLMLASGAFAEVNNRQDVAKEEMSNHLIGIQNLFETMYAPAEWKKEYAGWDLREAIQKAAEAVQEHPAITLKDYHEILVSLFSSPKDYHVSVRFHSTEMARLPFRVRGADGRYFVVWVDKNVAPSFPLNVGDEIISFNNMPVQETIKDLIPSGATGQPTATDLEQASIFLTVRAGLIGHRVPQGDVNIAYQPKGLTQHVECKLTWQHQEELIKALSHNASKQQDSKKQKAPKSKLDAIKKIGIHTNMSSPMASAMRTALSTKCAKNFPIGDRRGPLPFLGSPLWRSAKNKFFFSYIYRTPSGKTIGYLRVPHFEGGNYNVDDNEYDTSDMDDNDDNDIEELRLLTKMLQRKTNALVIDLVDNSGGRLDKLLAYLGILTDKPLPFFKQRLALTQEDAHKSLTFIALIDMWMEAIADEDDVDDKAELEKIRDYFVSIYKEWSEGRYLSQPLYLYGYDEITPDEEATYNKPILVLTNALDFSCADLFPAVLQDSGRALIFGSKTAGAGGVVQEHSYPNRMGISSYSYTASLVERLDRRPLENLGVTPDIPYEVTPDDIQNGYKGYIKAVNKALDDITH